MIRFYYGDDQFKARAKLNATVQSLVDKNPEASFVKLNEENFTVAMLEEAIGGQGLFKQKVLITCDHISEFTERYAKEISESENVFIFLEDKASKTLEKYSEKTEEFKLEKKEEKEKFYIWSISNALTARDRQGLWLAMQKAYMVGVAPEQIFWNLQWKTKDMILKGQSFKPARPSGGFQTQELKNLHSELNALWHDSHFGLTELDLGLERLALSL